jgi:glycerol uptake facilitator-like aquaporin
MYTRYLAEFFGTLVFVLAIVLTAQPLLIAGAFLAIILLAGPLGAGHINPAVTIAMIFKGDLPMSEAAPFIIAQVAGGLAAVQLAKMLKARM